jgi:hypothetical protein
VTIALVDGDIVAYRCSASAEKDGEEISLLRCDRLLKDIISVTDADEVAIYISGTSNFRYDVYPEYKANRKDLKRPVHLPRTREYLLLEWGAIITDGYEADDALGIEQTRRMGSSVLCTIDKDLRQVPGSHYNFVTGEFSDIDEVEGWRNFYRQLVLGDRGDNIPGFDGKMRLKFPQKFRDIQDRLGRSSTVAEMSHAVRDCYIKVGSTEETLIRNGKLLYIWREENDKFTVKTHLEATPEPKAEAVVNSASTVTTQEGSTRSTGRGSTKRKKGGSRVRGQSKASVSPKTSRVR